MSLQVVPDSSSQLFEAWESALSAVRKSSPSTFEQWFSGVQLDGFGEGVLALTARDEFVRDWVKTHFQPVLIDLLRASLGSDVNVEWRVCPDLEAPVCVLNVPDAPVRPRKLRLSDAPPNAAASGNRQATERQATHIAGFTRRDQLNERYTFRNFVVGPSNELAYAAAVASAGGNGRRFNPLFICGGTGLGKTHLMHAIEHQVLDVRPNACVVYVSAERFTNQFIEALQHHKMEEFRRRYRGECDVLLVDDIQFLAGREQTQEEFFHTFNALHDADKPIVVSSDKYPQDLQRMPERLISRFASGLVADVQTPALETRVAIVRKKAQLEDITLDDEDVALLIAQNVKSNVRELESMLIRLHMRASLMGRKIDLEFAREEFARASRNTYRHPEVYTVEAIQRVVCGYFRVTSADLLSKDRHKSITFARQVAMYLCRERLKCSFPELGRAFGNRDHTTVMSAVRRVEALKRTDPQVDAQLQAIENKLTSSEK